MTSHLDDDTNTARPEYDFYDIEFKDYNCPTEMNQETSMEDKKRDSGVYDSFPVQYKIYNEEGASERGTVPDDDGDEESLGQTE